MGKEYFEQRLNCFVRSVFVGYHGGKILEQDSVKGFISITLELLQTLEIIKRLTYRSRQHRL
jgi:hypothetical protein